MTSSGEDDLAEVAEEFRRKGWMIGPGREGGWTAWFPAVPRNGIGHGLMVLRDPTEAGIYKRAARFEQVFKDTTGDRDAAERAAKELDT